MARVNLTLRMDTSPTCDAIDLVGEVFKRLARRHGDRFRQLERRIEDLANARVPEATVHDLGEGYFVAAAPPVLADVLREARRLEVI